MKALPLKDTVSVLLGLLAAMMSAQNNSGQHTQTQLLAHACVSVAAVMFRPLL